MTYRIGKDITYIGLGEVAVEKSPFKIKTDLGSCVAVTFYDKKNKIAGMTHIVFPKNELSKETKFANNAIPELLKQMIEAGAKKENLECNVVGASKRFDSGVPLNLKNLIEISRTLERLEISVKNVDVGGEESRSLTLDASNGEISIKKMGKK